MRRLDFSELAGRYDSIVVLDTETSGLRPDFHEIIELAAARVEGGGPVEEYDRFIRLSPGARLDPRITELTGITQERLAGEGIEKADACRDFAALLGHGRTLVAAYNAQFDLAFLFYFLHRDGNAMLLGEADYLDVLTVYKDRRPYPHKLRDAIEGYGLGAKVVNSHRAIDDVLATVEVLRAMSQERADLDRYINLFGFNPKYGPAGRRFKKIAYLPQPYGSRRPLYEFLPPRAKETAPLG